MDEETLKTMPEYVQKLPQKVRDFVFDGVWEQRTGEIATKYSLNDNQTDILINEVLFILIGLKAPETFGASLETELGISELLTEQIMSDLDTRVFQYAFELISKESESSIFLPKSQGGTFDTLDKQTEEVEVPPVILPMVESDEERKKMAEQNRIANTERPAADIAGALRASIGNSIPLSARPVAPQVPSNLPGVVVPRPDADVATPQIQDGRFVGSEFAQKPIAVPRFNVVNAPETAPATVAAPKQNIIDTKLNSVTSANADKKSEVQNPPRYTDPYRESIE